MIIIAEIVLIPSIVNVKQSFTIQVITVELPSELIRYCGTFSSGQVFAF